ncbi:MAG: Rho termination factor N-terminal domain-containing protein [Bacilli bacterium]
MQKALETVKPKQERRKPFNNDRNDRRDNNNRPFRRFNNDNRNFDNRGPRREFVKREETVETVKPVVETVKPVVEVKPEPKKAEVKFDLTEKTVAELRDLAKAKDIKGYSTMKKAELLDALK